MLLGGASVVLHPLILDALSLACCSQVKVHQGFLRDAPSNVCQELKMVSIITSNAVEAFQAKVALKAAPSVVKVVSPPAPPKPEGPKSSFC